MKSRINTGATGTATVGHKTSRVRSLARFFSGKNKKLDLKMESVYSYDIKFEDMETWLLERFPNVSQDKLNLKKDNDLYTFWIPKDESLGQDDNAAVERLRKPA